jgi:hypothetical protein
VETEIDFRAEAAPEPNWLYQHDLCGEMGL